MKRKLAVVIPKYGLPGGAERFAFEVTERLAADPALEVHVLAHRRRMGPAPIVWHRIPILPWPRFLRPVSFAGFVRRRLQREGIHLVHSHERIFEADCFTLHGLPHRAWVREIEGRRPRLLDRTQAWVEARGYSAPRARLFLPVSTLVAEALQRAYPIARDRIRVIHPGVDLERFAAAAAAPGTRTELRARYGLMPQDLVVLFVGMNFAHKGLAELIAGCARHTANAPATAPPLKLLILGKGRPEPYRTLARRLGVADRLVFAGTVRDMEAHYQAGDLLALPSRFETFGMVVLEAMAAGLPVLLTPRVGACDLVRHGEQGLVLSARPEADELAAGLNRLASPAERRRMGTNARQAAQAHDWSHVARQVAAALSDLPRVRTR